jgi:hypothetical protein
VRGSYVLIGARWLLWIAAALPGMLLGTAALEAGPASASAFASSPQPFPAVDLLRFLSRVPGVVPAAALAGAALAWLGHQLLTAGAITVFSARAGEAPGIRRAITQVGVRSLPAFLRVALLAAVALWVAGTLTGAVFSRLAEQAELAGATARTLIVTLPLAQAATLLTIAAVIGTWAMWCRVVLVAQGRRYVRRLPGIAIRLTARWPLQALALQVALISLSMLLGAAVLVAWRQSGARQTMVWLPVWLLVLLGQSFLWHWRCRACCGLWVAAGHDRWGSIPDAPWHVVRRSWLRLRSRRQAPLSSTR